jgi:uncharacterized membrane protein YedE/YeeE
MSWVYGGILLGLLNTFAVATYGALGVSRNYVVLDNLILRLFGSDLDGSNSYLGGVPSTADWLFMLSVGMVVGGFLAAIIKGKLNMRSVPRLWASRFGESKAKRFTAAFAGGFLLLFGARLAGGCTSGLVLSGVAQMALAGFLFGAAILFSGIVTARLLYRKQGS